MTTLYRPSPAGVAVLLLAALMLAGALRQQRIERTMQRVRQCRAQTRSSRRRRRRKKGSDCQVSFEIPGGTVTINFEQGG